MTKFRAEFPNFMQNLETPALCGVVKHCQLGCSPKTGGVREVLGGAQISLMSNVSSVISVTSTKSLRELKTKL